MKFVIAATSDWHAGSLLGIMHPSGFTLDDGQHISPSRGQLWLYQCFADFYDRVAEVVKLESADALVHVLNGDLVDGDHHNTHQIVSRAEGAHFRIADEVAELPLSMGADAIFVQRGTPSHVGPSGGHEEALAAAWHDRGLPVERDPDTGSWSSPQRWLDFEGYRINLAHTGRTGQTPYTRGSYARLAAFRVWADYAMRLDFEPDGTVTGGELPPHLCLRSHKHTFTDSGKPEESGIPTRVIQMPAFQLQTEWARNLPMLVDTVADIGGIIVVVTDGRAEVRPVRFFAKRGETWSASKSLKARSSNS